MDVADPVRPVAGVKHPAGSRMPPREAKPPAGVCDHGGVRSVSLSSNQYLRCGNRLALTTLASCRQNRLSLPARNESEILLQILLFRIAHSRYAWIIPWRGQVAAPPFLGTAYREEMRK